ncbi:MAG: hypothetical protein AAFV29_04395, partial [Myxococcota bacterium]
MQAAYRAFRNIGRPAARSALDDFPETAAREIAGLSDVAASVAQRFEHNETPPALRMQNLLTDATQSVIDELGRPDIERAARRWPANISESAIRRLQMSIESQPSRWADQISAMAAALALDLQVSALA